MIPIAKPYIGREETEAVLEVMNSGQLAQGPRVKAFEKSFAAYIGVKHAVAVTSGTAALHLALLAHGIGPGDAVITTPFTFIASANSILFTGARPVFADIDPISYNIDPAQIEAKITPNTKAILVVHLYGNPADLQAIQAIAKRYNLTVIEDCAQAHGAAINNQKVGSFYTGAFSFYPTKNMTTGEGGIITTNDDGVAERAVLWREHGAPRRYHHTHLGFNLRMTDLCAAIGLVQLDRLEAWNEMRINNAKFLSENLKTFAPPAIADGIRHVFHQYTVRVPSDREAVIEKLAQRGVQTSIHYPVPVHQQPYYQEIGYNKDAYSVAETAAREVLCLPVHPGLSQQDLNTIVAEVNAL
jgi:dTDP-4-amino-4,6-dideoxygalactose transaminase